MTDPTDDDITIAMIHFGGSFVAALGQLFRQADPVNQARLKAAFSDVWATYRELLSMKQRSA